LKDDSKGILTMWMMNLKTASSMQTRDSCRMIELLADYRRNMMVNIKKWSTTIIFSFYHQFE
jgi:hypothetical protein